jgi:queuosine precursor transporter
MMAGFSEQEARKSSRLFLILAGFFLTNALLAEFIGVKIFSVEKTLGFDEARIPILGEVLSFNLTAGVLLWPVVFVITDLVNEYYGRKGVQKLTWLAVVLIVYAFVAVRLAIGLTPTDWWVRSAASKGLQDLNNAFNQVFGQGLFIIAGSLTAFLIGQIVDARIFRMLRLKTGDKGIWIRATGSTLVSQLIDSYVVLFVAFYWGADWPIKQVIAVGTMGYMYKLFMALVLIPLLYGVHAVIDRYLGKELAGKMTQQAVK